MSELVNLSTRAYVRVEDSVLIGGFVVGGSQPKSVFIRGIGPSLKEAGIENTIEDPIIILFDSDGFPMLTNDDTDHLGPLDLRLNNHLESSIWEMLLPGAYTVVLRDKSNLTDVGLIEIYADPN